MNTLVFLAALFVASVCSGCAGPNVIRVNPDEHEMVKIRRPDGSIFIVPSMEQDHVHIQQPPVVIQQTPPQQVTVVTQVVEKFVHPPIKSEPQPKVEVNVNVYGKPVRCSKCHKYHSAVKIICGKCNKQHTGACEPKVYHRPMNAPLPQSHFPPDPVREKEVWSRYHGYGGDYDMRYSQGSDTSVQQAITPWGPQVTGYNQSSHVNYNESWSAPRVPYIPPLQSGTWFGPNGYYGNYGGGGTYYDGGGHSTYTTR